MIDIVKTAAESESVGVSKRVGVQSLNRFYLNNGLMGLWTSTVARITFLTQAPRTGVPEVQPLKSNISTPTLSRRLNSRYLTAVIILIISFFAITALSAAPADDLYNKMITSYGKLTSWQATVNQTNVFKQSNATLNSTGTFYFQKGKLAIRYNKPNEQQLTVVNGKLSVYDKATNTVMKSSLSSAIASLNPVEIVKSYWAKSQHTITGTAKGFSTVKITPAKDPSVKDITLKIDNTTGYIHQFQYTDKQGNSLSIAFAKIKINPTIPASVFKLSYPAGAKIYQQ